MAPGDPLYYSVLGVVFFGVVGLFASVRYVVTHRPHPVRDRLQRTVESASSGVAGWLLTAAPPTHAPGIFRKVLEAISSAARPRGEGELGGLRTRLAYAGFRRDSALTLYLVSQVLLCVGIGGAAATYTMLADPPVRHAPAWILVALALGFYLPPLWLRGRITERQAEIGRALPDALDLIITCVEAGIGVDAALDRVAGEVRLSAPLLAGELQQASREMRAGVPRGESFRRLARRTGVDELRTLAAVVVQTELFGTSLAATLRVQADGIRTRRTQVAEERAGKVGVLLSVPLILCILPALFVVLIGPAIVSFVRVLMPTLMGK